MDDYAGFLAEKLAHDKPSGFSVRIATPHLFPFQRDLVAWALRRGRSAIFASTGLGKTRIQLEWARHVANEAQGRVLVLAPLAVAAQTAMEAEVIGVDASVCRSQADVKSMVSVANYVGLPLQVVVQDYNHWVGKR